MLQEYISDFNFTRKKQVALLKISNGKKWHFLALKSDQEENSEFIRPTKSFSRLMARITSNSHKNHYCFGCFHSFRCNSTLEKHTDLCKDNDFCKINLPEVGENNKEHDFGSKSLRMNYIIYVDLECLLVKYDTCTNNSNRSYTINEAQHIPSGYSISILDNSTNSSKVLYYREKDCNQKLCKELREIGEELFDTEENPMIPLTPEQKRFHNNAKRCHICQSQFYSEDHVSVKSTNYRKVKDHDHYTGIYRGAAHSICNLRYSTQRDIFVVIHNGTNYDFHLIIKELNEEFRTEIQCIPEDKEKYKSFSIPIMYKECNDYTIPYNLRFIDSNKFMMGSLDSHVNNLSELYSCNCSNKSNQQIKIKHNDKNIYRRCKTCTKRSKQSVESLKLKSPNTYQLTNGNIEKFILLLKKGVYPYEYMDSWNKFEEEELPSMD